jgi:outer membrane protein assembly factor BamD (BamD/ComL family)
MKRSEMKNGILILILALIQTIAFGQTKSEKKELADEYLKRENYQKALDNYEDLVGDEAWDPLIFKNYILCLDKLKPTKSESVIKKYLKRYPQEIMYQTFQFTWLKNVKKDEKDFQKYTRSKLIPWFLQTSERTRFGYSFFLQNQNPDFAAVILDDGIKQFGLSAMWKEVFQAQLAEKKYPQLSQTIMQLLDQKVLDENELEAYLQEHIAIDELARLLQIELLKSIQLKPSAIVYPSFLGWIYVQKKDFEGALIQYRALDLLQNTGGTRCYQLGEFAVNNDLIPLAIKSFEFVINSFPASQYRFLAQQKIVQLREDRVRNTYPVKTEEVRALIAEYNNLAQSQYLNLYDLNMKVAELYGKYLNRPDSSIFILEESMKTRRWPSIFQNKAKILLGDMYILKDEPWEASLLYGQVEKDEAESLVGYEAKLKNAKVFYFKGEFELCQEQLDVLKQSTSRDISNDAIELGLLLQDLLAEDTTGYFLSKFADIDLLTFQGNYPAAIDQIEKLTLTISNPVVLEKLKYRLFTNFYATRQFEKSLEQLDQIYKAKASDLYLDDALFNSGVIYSDQLKDKEKAMGFFLSLIKEHPGSVYVAESRKRLRILRGDSAN